MKDRSLCDYRENPCRTNDAGEAVRAYTNAAVVSIPRAWMADLGIFVTDRIVVRRCEDHLEIWPTQEEK